MTRIIFLFLLFSCGDNEGKNRCVSREAKILECRSLEASANYFNSAAMLEAQKEKCERAYVVNQCY
jgi:uncharacterized SAM-binding protein YcdF (DUF218 family)